MPMSYARVVPLPKNKRMDKFILEAFLTALLQEKSSGVLRLPNLFTLIEPYLKKGFILLTIEKGWVNFDGKMMFKLGDFSVEFMTHAANEAVKEFTLRKNLTIQRYERHSGKYEIIAHSEKLLKDLLQHFTFIAHEESRINRETHITISDGEFLIESFDNSKFIELETPPKFRKYNIKEL